MKSRVAVTLALAGVLSVGSVTTVALSDPEESAFDLDSYGWCVALANELNPLFLSTGSGIDAEQAETVSACMSIDPVEVLLGVQQHEPLDLWDAVDRHETAAALFSIEYDKAGGAVELLRLVVRNLWRGILLDPPKWWYSVDYRKVKKKPVRRWAVRAERELEQGVATVEAYEFLPCMGDVKTPMLRLADSTASDLQALRGTSGEEAFDRILDLTTQPSEYDDSWWDVCRLELVNWELVEAAMERDDGAEEE